MSNLTEQVYNKLLDMIVEERYKPGDRLPSEMVLCDRFSVSRNTLRAALNKLNILGLTETKQGGGTFVKEVSSEVYMNFFLPSLLTSNINLLQAMEFRRGIETEAARLAAVNRTEDDIAKMRTCLDRCKDNIHDMSGFENANNEFHNCIAEASRNPLFIQIMSILHRMISTVMKDYLKNQGADIDSTFYHEMILNCIIERKPDEAAFFMDRHMTFLVRRVRDYIAEKNNNS